MKKILPISLFSFMFLLFACTVKKPVQEIAQTPAKKEVIEQINSNNNLFVYANILKIVQ